MKTKLQENQTVIQQNNSKIIHLSDLEELSNQEAEMVTGGWDTSGTGGTAPGNGSGTWFEVSGSA